MGQKLLLADGHLLTDSVSLQYGWAGCQKCNVDSFAQQSCRRSLWDQMEGMVRSESAWDVGADKQGLSALEVLPGGEELAQMSSGIQRAQP